MISLWVAAALLAGGAAALMFRRAGRAAKAVARDDPQIEVYRRAISEIDDLASRDLLAADERRGLRAEAARRLIGAAERPSASLIASTSPWVPIVAATSVTLISLAIYAEIGSPNLPDLPFSSRLADWETHPETASPAGLAAALNAMADRRPTDPTPLRKLASLDLGLGDADGAAHALRKAMLVAPGDADLPAMLGEVKVLQGGGSVTPEARALFVEARRRDPNQAAARYYLAEARIVDGDLAGGLADWRALLSSLASADPRRGALAAQIAATEQAGRLVATSSGDSGPSPQDMSGAIRGMVDGLAARLQAQPDDPQGWVRLVRAYAVLGEGASRDQALAGARARFYNRPDVLSALAAAAKASPMKSFAN